MARKKHVWQVGLDNLRAAYEIEEARLAKEWLAEYGDTGPLAPDPLQPYYDMLDDLDPMVIDLMLSLP